jgi:phospholipase C
MAPSPAGWPRPLLSRRQLLGGALAGGAGLALSTTAGRLIEKAAAQTPCHSLDDIQHVVILIMENRSFDHIFGTFRGVAGFADPHVLRQPAHGGRPAWYQYGWAPGDTKPEPSHYLSPFRLDTTEARTDAECVNDITHAWVAQHLCWNGGAMDRWVRAHIADDGVAGGPTTMGFYTREDLGFYYGLADAFTLCDRYHCSVLGPTVPNRLYSMSATIDPHGSLGGGPVVSNPAAGVELAPGGSAADFRWRTAPEALEEHGVSWKVYQQPGSQTTDRFSDTVLYYFPPFRDPASPLFQKGMVPSFPGDFQTDVAAGTLPQVSWLVPTSPLDEHPPAPPPLGQLEVTRQVLSTLVANPDIWRSTVLFVTYDENGGFFDHIPPPTAPRGTAGEWLTTKPAVGSNVAAGGTVVDGPIGLGFRVPMLVLSPFAVGGLVCSDTFDHTSTLRFIETRFGVPVPNLSRWRRANTGDLTSAINFAAGARSTPTSVQDLVAAGTGAAADTQREAAQCSEMAVSTFEPKPYPVPTPQSLPGQEPGRARRPSGPVCRS